MESAVQRHTDRTERPASAVPARDGYVGLLGFVAGWAVIAALQPPLVASAWILLLATALPMAWRELRRDHPCAVTAPRPFAPVPWIAGFIIATVPVLLIHLQHQPLVFWLMGWTIAAPAILVVWILERRRRLPGGGDLAQALGEMLLRAGPRPSAEAARQWLLKGFFIPLYAVSLAALVRLVLTSEAWLAGVVALAYSIDLTFGLAGYLFATKALPCRIRSTQSSVLGWVSCLLCYGPLFHLWPAAEQMVRHEIGWPDLVTGATPVLTAALLILLGIYIWATVAFGLRFSNLSNRGVITHGPYRWMKHPAYFAHIGNSWLITGLLAARAEFALPMLAVPLAFTVLYTLRAVTEERHLSEDEDYRAYCRFIAKHGLLAILTRHPRRALTALASSVR